MRVHDLWNLTAGGGDLGEHTTSISLTVASHGSRMIVLKPVADEPPAGAPHKQRIKVDDSDRGNNPSSTPLVPAGAGAGGCQTDLDCNLNGVCSAASSACQCDAPWAGENCGTIGYAIVPASRAKDMDIFNASNPINTWGGPIIGPEKDGKYHAFIPKYAPGALFGAKHVLHGTADTITGPYSWAAMTDVAGGINPAFLIFPNTSNGNQPVFSLWLRGKIHVADSAAGPYRVLEASYPGAPNANPAPVFHDGAFYLTTQHTDTVWMTPSLLPSPNTDPEVRWQVFATIPHGDVPAGVVPEDPYMYVLPFLRARSFEVPLLYADTSNRLHAYQVRGPTK